MWGMVVGFEDKNKEKFDFSNIIGKKMWLNVQLFQYILIKVFDLILCTKP